MVVEIVTVDTPAPFSEGGLKAALAPAGKTALNPTLPLNPLVPVTVTVKVVLLPAVTIRESGEAASWKSGAATLTLRFAPKRLLPGRG